MEKNLEQFVDSSIVNLKKAVSSYNNFLNEERIEDFIIFYHISLNRLLIAYCIKNNFEYFKIKKREKGSIKSFDELVNLICSKGILKSEEKNFFKTLNVIRNSLAHDSPTRSDINSQTSYVFLNALIQLWQKLKLKVDAEKVINHSLFLVPPSIDTWKVDDCKSEYVIRIEKLMKHDLAIKKFQELGFLIFRSKNWMADNEDKSEALSRIRDDTFLPGNFVKKMKNHIPDFSSHIFSCTAHVFSIKTDCWTYKNWNINENKHNKKYTIKNELTNQLLYTSDYFNKILNVCISYDNYQKFFKRAYKEKVHFDIDKFEWENIDVKEFINSKLDK